MLIDIHYSFTVVFFEKFATKSMSHCPLYLRCVAALPCETKNLKFNHFQLQLLLTLPKNLPKNYQKIAHSTFSKSVMVSMDVSKLGRMDLI